MRLKGQAISTYRSGMIVHSHGQPWACTICLLEVMFMPDPNSFENQEEFMKVCVPKVLEDGTAKDNDQAVAICLQMWQDKGKSFDIQSRQYAIDRAFQVLYPYPEPVALPMADNTPWIVAYLDDSVIICRDGKYYKATYTTTGEDVTLQDQSQWVEVARQSDWITKAFKVGARHSEDDKQALQDIHDAAITLGASCPDVTKWPQPKALVIDGSEVKALGNGRIGGYLIWFSTAQDPDLEGDYFTKETDFGKHLKNIPLYYQHGMDPAIKKRKIGTGNLTFDDVGGWLEGQLELRDEYEKAIYSLAEKGKLGLSSGTASHLVDRVPAGKAYWLKSWPIGLDASLTPTPAEPRNVATPIKSMLLDEIAEDQVLIALRQVNNIEYLAQISNIYGGIKMEKDELIKLLDERDAIKATQVADQQKHEAEIKAAEEAGYKKALAELKTTRRGGYAYHRASGAMSNSEGANNEEIKSFLYWIRTGDEAPYKAAMQEQNDSEGGFYVPEQYTNQIVAKRSEASVPAQIGCATFTTNSDRLLVPAEGTAATKFVVAAEEAAYDENEPTAGQVAITIQKLTKLVKISEELEEDAVSDFGNYLAGVWGRAMAAADNYYMVASGTGGGEPQSMLVGGTLLATTAAPTAITAAEFITALFSYPDQYSDGAVLICKRDVLGYLRGLLIATPYAFIAANDPMIGQGNAKAHGTIMGIPVYCTAALTGLTTNLPVASTKHILLVNPGFYGIANKTGMSVTRNPYLYQATGQIGLFAKYRQGGAVLQSEAITYLLQHA